MPLGLLAPLFVRLGTHKASVLAAIESLHSQQPTQLPAAAAEPELLGLGAALTALVDYIADEPRYKHGRLLALLQARPTLGDGAVPLDTCHLCPPSAAFYRGLATAACDAGLCIDLLCVGTRLAYVTPHLPFDSLTADGAAPLSAGDGADSLGLAAVHWLCTYTGGTLLLYSRASAGNMPHDVYRLLSRPMAFQCLLRLRTPPSVRATVLSPVQPHGTFADLLQLAGCDSFKSLTFEFDFVSPDGFAGQQSEAAPVVQLALSCAYFCPVRRRLRRVVRVHTVVLGIARSPQEVYEKADASVIVSLMARKLLTPVVEKAMPISEARLVAQDWLVVLLSHYSQYMARLASRPIGKSSDVSFSRYPNLKNLTRFVFGLIKSSLLSSSTPPPADVWIYLNSVYSNLAPSLLQRAIYPTMSSWGAPSILSSPSVNLSASGLSTSTCRLFVCDALFMLVMFYLAPSTEPTSQEPPPLFPPAKDSTPLFPPAKDSTPLFPPAKDSKPLFLGRLTSGLSCQAPYG
eukprot:TRINITY_DN356_c0_g1_i5.p1 TRINITY_DN356_c0_g1~~TRINITY_DN356_c0_g1_i5.p1  ORF type:complete len:517 (-),score=180.79 TRINITY_DN356_c0_g1_i5:482-2032(-)